MSTSTPTFAKLGPTNYSLWAGDMEAWFRALALWRIVNGTSLRPARVGDITPSPDAVEAWETKADKAAGWIWLPDVVTFPF